MGGQCEALGARGLVAPSSSDGGRGGGDGEAEGGGEMGGDGAPARTPGTHPTVAGGTAAGQKPWLTHFASADESHAQLPSVSGPQPSADATAKMSARDASPVEQVGCVMPYGVRSIAVSQPIEQQYGTVLLAQWPPSARPGRRR